MFLDPFIIVQFIQKNPTRWNSVSKFYLIFIWSSTCFGRHTAHHQEPKTALAVSGFAYVEGCWTCGCWTLSAFYVCKTRGCCAILGSWWWAVCRPKHVWASCKYGIINFDTMLHLVGFFIWIELWCTDPRTSNIHLQLVPRLRMNGVVPLIPVYAFMAQTRKNLPFLPFSTFIQDVF